MKDDTKILDIFLAISAIAGRETLSMFRLNPDVTDKGDGAFDPVTLADRNTESAIREFLMEKFPEDGFLGEETGGVKASSGRRWVVDPIDGTKAFIAGLPSWGTLVGLEENGVPVAGMMHQPFTGEIFIGLEGKAFSLRNDLRADLKASANRFLKDAILMSTGPDLFSPSEFDRFQSVAAKARSVRYGFDCYAYCMLAAGHVDIVIEAGLNAYDLLPLIPIIRNAGGVVCNWDGKADVAEGQVIAAANQPLMDEILQVI